MLEYTVVQASERRERYASVKKCDNFECGRKFGDDPILISNTQLGPKGLCQVCAIQEIGNAMSRLSVMLDAVRPRKRK